MLPMPSLFHELTIVVTSVTLMPTDCEILYRLELYVEEIADAAMLVVCFVRSVKLQVNAVLAGGFRGFAKFDVLGVSDAVGRGQNSVKTDLLRVCDSVQKIRRKRRLAAGEQNDDLTFRLERNCPVEDRFCVLKCRFMNVADLIRIHEARIAHHVAAVCQIDRQNRAAAEFDIARAVMMNVLVLGGLEIAAEKERLDPLQKLRVSREHVHKLAVRRARLSHDYLAVLLDDLGLDLARMSVHQDVQRDVAGDDAVANRLDAGRAKRIGLSRESKRRSGPSRKI